MIGNFVANMVTIPGNSPVFESPKDYGLKYEDVNFKAADGVTLSGWLIPGDDDKIIIQQHFASQCSRAGYSPKSNRGVALWDEDISFLRQAKYLHEEGYTVLMYDFRNHGNSDRGTSEYVTGGPEESKDVIAAVQYISEHPKYKNANIGLFSICMGTNATSLAYGVEGGLQEYSNIKAYLSVQPLNYGDFLENMGLPSFLVRRGNKANLKRGGKDFYTTPYENLKSLKIPTLILQNTNDPWTNMESINKYYNSIAGDKEMLWLDLEKKRAAAYDYVGREPEKIIEFFTKHL